jgi:CspA family cold shock protein
MSSYKDAVTPSVASEHLLGRVKWFNNKAGFGFITVTDGPRSGSDIFVHHSAINVENQQYKYLVQGEYVEFNLVRTESAQHEWQASRVSGVRGGKLMCETRRDLKLARNEYRASRTTESSNQTESQETAEPKMPRQRAPREAAQTGENESRQRRTSVPRVRGEGPRESTNDKKEWTLVSKNGPKKVNGRPPRQGSTVITIQSK